MRLRNHFFEHADRSYYHQISLEKITGDPGSFRAEYQRRFQKCSEIWIYRTKIISGLKTKSGKADHMPLQKLVSYLIKNRQMECDGSMQ